MRRVCEVESFSSKLHLYVFRKPEGSEQPEVEVHCPGSLNRVESSGPEPGLGNCGPSERIIEWLPGPNISELLRFSRLDSITALEVVAFREVPDERMLK